MKNLEYNKYKVQLVGTFKEDLRNIYNYIYQVLQEPLVAKRLIHKIRQEMKILETSPYGCQKIYVKPQNELYRRLIIGKYIVLYQINEEQKEVLVSRIFYGKRDYLAIDD